MFVYPSFNQNRWLAIVFATLAGCFVAGCGGDQPRGDQDTEYYTDQSRAVFAPEPEHSPSLDADIPNEAEPSNIGGWSIVLSNVGSGGKERAKEMLRIVQDEAGLKEAYIDQRSTGLVIAFGDYLDKSDPKAISDLKRIRGVDLMGVKLFEGAVITPPTSEALRGSNPSYDLRTVRRRFGPRAVYTLQIGIYGRSDYQAPSAEDLRAFRRAAEDAVRELRARGETAFYYHAPARSMVTIGVFSERDFDPSTLPPMQSPQLKALRERFPNNLLNGQGINETVRTESGKTTRLQSSQLVGIPDQ